MSSVHPVSEAECAKVHAAAVRVPAEGGIRCDDPSASRMFEAVGCTLESGGTLVKIPERVIMDALAQCPESFTLYGRNNPTLDCSFGTGEVHFCPVSGRCLYPKGPNFYDGLRFLPMLFQSSLWSSPQKVVHLLVWEINPILNMKGGLKWLRKDTNPKKS